MADVALPSGYTLLLMFAWLWGTATCDRNVSRLCEIDAEELDSWLMNSSPSAVSRFPSSLGHPHNRLSFCWLREELSFDCGVALKRGNPDSAE